MIVLDTNVLSEVMKAEPAPVVRTWFRRQPRSSLYTTTISVAETRSGIAQLPRGRRRQNLEQAADRLFGMLLGGRVLPFDLDAAEVYAEVLAERSRLGRPIQPLDSQIAAIARSRGAQVATRNVHDFSDCGLGLINPWD